MSTNIVKTEETLLALLTDNTRFNDEYGDKIKEISDELPSKRDFEKIIDNLPENLKDKVTAIAKKMAGKRKGQYGEQDNTNLTELKLYQGTGKDPNRPEKQIPGEFYLTTKTNIGEIYRGTVLTTISGQSMWETGDSKQPKCRSMDRHIGNNFGECSNCIHRPWRNRQRQLCSRDVTAYLVPNTLDDIVLARFTKTSEPAGRRLLSFINKGIGENWSRWFDFTSNEQENKEDPSKRYFIWNIQPVAGDSGYTPEELDGFFFALCTLIEATYILPNIARIYEQAKDGEANLQAEVNSPSVDDEDDGSDSSAYAEVPEAPTDI